MNSTFVKILFCISIFSTLIFAQSEENLQSNFRVYFEKLEKQQSFIAECEAATAENQIKEFGRVLPKISGECEWGNNGCPISLVKPAYSEFARVRNVFATVEVEIIIDKTGKVVYAKPISGNALLYSTAKQAASNSRFYPKTVCGETVLQRKIIRYNFIPQ